MLSHYIPPSTCEIKTIVINLAIITFYVQRSQDILSNVQIIFRSLYAFVQERLNLYLRVLKHVLKQQTLNMS
jgi:hypothetical protein